MTKHSEKPFRIIAKGRASGRVQTLKGFDDYAEAREELQANLPEMREFFDLWIERPVRERRPSTR